MILHLMGNGMDTTVHCTLFTKVCDSRILPVLCRMYDCFDQIFASLSSFSACFFFCSSIMI